MPIIQVLAALPRAVIAAVTFLLAIVIAGLVVLYVATPVGSRPNVWQYLGGVGVAVGFSVPSIAAWVRSTLTHREVQVTTQAVEQVKEQTNGVLDARISTQVRAALADFYADLAATYPKLPAIPAPTAAPQSSAPASPAGTDPAPGVVL